MPRNSRSVAVGYPHHVTQRGNNRETVFLDDEDRSVYLEQLSHFTQKYHVDIWAYCLMSNHVHLLVVPHAPESLARGIGLTNMSYTQHVNRKYRRSGRIWQNRFFSSVVATERYLWAVARYIEKNPVVAGIVDAAGDYRWSSAPGHLCANLDPYLKQPSWLSDRERDAYASFHRNQDDMRMTALIEQAARGNRSI
jgi:putative transposase